MISGSPSATHRVLDLHTSGKRQPSGVIGDMDEVRAVINDAWPTGRVRGAARADAAVRFYQCAELVLAVRKLALGAEGARAALEVEAELGLREVDGRAAGDAGAHRRGRDGEEVSEL